MSARLLYYMCTSGDVACRRLVLVEVRVSVTIWLQQGVRAAQLESGCACSWRKAAQCSFAEAIIA